MYNFQQLESIIALKCIPTVTSQKAQIGSHSCIKSSSSINMFIAEWSTLVQPYKTLNPKP